MTREPGYMYVFYAYLCTHYTYLHIIIRCVYKNINCVIIQCFVRESMHQNKKYKYNQGIVKKFTVHFMLNFI